MAELKDICLDIGTFVQDPLFRLRLDISGHEELRSAAAEHNDS